MALKVSEVVEPFTPQLLLRPLAVDSALRWLMLGALLLAVFNGGESPLLPLGPTGWNIIVLVLAVIWVSSSTGSTRVAQQIPQLGPMIERDPAAAEAALATLLPRRMLQRPVRLLLFHQLAGLRHRQQRFGEAAAICQTLLSQIPSQSRNGLRLPGILPAGQNVRAQLLLMLAEARLHCRDLFGAWVALAELSRCNLNLVESLQRLALQTQYEVAAGHDAHALWRLNEKISHAELMPGPQCGAFHAMVAVAAERTGQTELAQWLSARAELMCTAEQLTQLRREFFRQDEQV